MLMNQIVKGLAVFTASTVLSLSTVQTAYAAPGTLANSPLFLSTSVEPNIYFTIDDSGSMDFNSIVEEGLGGVGPDNTGGIVTYRGQPYIVDGYRRTYYSPTFTTVYSNRYVLPPVDDAHEDWIATWMLRTHNGNLTYYNPSITYKPWPGSNADGSPMFTDANPTNVFKDPWNTDSQKMDLTTTYRFCEEYEEASGDVEYCADLYLPTYWIWDDHIKLRTDANKKVIDDDGDGVYDSKDGNPTTPNGILEYDDGRREVVIKADDEAEMQNFANWFQYHRSRMNAAKYIIGTTINGTDATRMGMRLFNAGPIKEPGAHYTTPPLNVESMTDPEKKRELLEAFYSHDVKSGGTPMRKSLYDTGRYFEENHSKAPILSKAKGGECQQNFNILMGDGFWSKEFSGVDNRDKDGGAGNTIFDGASTGGPGGGPQSNDGGNYADEWLNTLADIAMRNYERDLRDNLKNRVPISPGIDENPQQHLVTYGIAFGVKGNLDPDKQNPTDPDFPGWPNPLPEGNEEERIDDMWHAAYNGRGKYFSSQQPDQLEAALTAAIADIAERTATASAVSVNSAKLTTETVIYLAEFNTNRWQGDLKAHKIADLDTGELSNTPEWSAADELNTRNLVTNPRTILTYSGSQGKPFQWGDLTTEQKDDLNTNPSGRRSDKDEVGMARLEYLRGERKDEGTGYSFRTRGSLFADLIHSGPVFVGAPALDWPDTKPFPHRPGSRYSDFKKGPAKSRQGAVYAGTNGGMLHGFSDTTGEELIAYVADSLYSTRPNEGLHYLTDPDYLHRYYNDLTPTISDVYADFGNGDKWQTILVAGLRGGGRGVFALNVNDPNQFSEDNADDLVLWEFTNDDDRDLGYTYSRPQIGLANDGRWVAIFGNGYNDTGDGEAKLFILDIENGTDGDWSDSGDYIEISTNVGDATNRNGLSEPAMADLDGNGTIDRVYAGDLRGNMWVFDLSDKSARRWSMPTAAPLFTTVDNRPITSKPSLAKHPRIQDNSTNAPNVMVFAGSGQYLVDADKTSKPDNYFYGVWDRGDYGLNSDNLVQQKLDNAYSERVLTDNTVNYGGGEYGWYFELPDTGERSVTNSVVRGRVVFFNTFVPESDPCSVGGYGYRWAVDMITGSNPENPVFDYNKDGVIDDNDRVDGRGPGEPPKPPQPPKEDGFLPEPVFVEDIVYTANRPDLVEELENIPRGRFSWQELIR